MCMACVLPGVRPTIAIFAVTSLVWGSQVSVTVPDGSLPRGTMTWAGPFAAVLDVPDPTDVALEVLADGVELDPQPTTRAAAAAALLAIANVRDLVVSIRTMTLRLSRTFWPLAASVITDVTAGEGGLSRAALSF